MVEKLVEYLKKCSDAYYNSGDVIVNDDTYDAMVESLRKLDPNNPYLNEVGANPRKDSKKVGRVVPMGTLSKYHEEDAVEEWLSKESGNVLLAPKYDGFGVELTYNDGFLVMASTRGNGHVGEDVTEAVMRIQSVPISLPPEFKSLTRVRGECIIPREHHDKMKELGYSAMRNAVPGIVKSNRKDALMFVDFVAYEFFDDSVHRNYQRVRYSEIFNIEDFTLYDSRLFRQILEHREYFGKCKDSYKYELDGVVLKTDLIKEDDLLCPKHQIAWKFKSNRRTTELNSVEYQMGLTGKFTPIGHFNEVEFQGAKLRKASLGNMTRLVKEFEGLTVGSLVEVSRRGDIIPYIEELSFINEDGEPIKNLTHCPYCGQELVFDELEPRCLNKSCPEKLNMQISFFARSIGVKGIGDTLIRKLIEAKEIQSITDIYQMDPEVILNIPRQGKSAVEKWKNLQSKWLTPLEIYSAYPFENLGAKVWTLVLNHYSPKEILNLTREKLSSKNIKGLGSSKIESIITQVQENKEDLEYLLNLHESMR